MLVVVPNSARSENLLDDLYLLLGEENVCFMPPGGNVSLSRLTPEMAEHHRSEALRRIANAPPLCLVVLPGTLLEQFPSRKALFDNMLHLRLGNTVEPIAFMRRLLNAGFRREVQVSGCGEAALRGGILDVFPYGQKNPIRIEFWGNVINSLREFDPRNQRSMTNLDYTEILLQRENPSTDSIFNLMDGIVFWDDITEIEQRYCRLSDSVDNPLDLTPPDRINILHRPLGQGEFKFGGSLAEMLMGSEADFLSKTQRYLSAGYRVMVGTESAHRQEKLRENMVHANGEFSDRLEIGTLPLQRGFIFPSAKLVFYTERELYDRPRPRRSFARFRTYAHPIEPEALKQGDFVVHSDYGIGLFQGLKQIKVAGHERECLHILYRDKVSLYVRLESFSKVQKYSGREGFVPAVSKIGGREWEKARNRTKKALKDMTRELLMLQAKRELKGGISFARDDVWQKELEESFIYEDTPDQSRVTEEVKRDMESERPMDRLLLGDVGFGKTEIAVRAAFKAIQSNCQVALLAPTTILVQQHLATFQQRMAHYPVVIEALSRFRTPAEQRKVIQGLRTGTVDIVIGTHRLLSKDVSFRRLGLLIVDEEHRFGVRHKEKLKQLRAEVDVLTLTATPIPRTLHFALSGTKDISRIETPPANRLSIVTEIVPFDKGLIREAMLYELQRGGQVFFVHNRVRSIEALRSMLMRIAPEARYGVAHGQTPSRELEKVMVDFLHKKFDCLICTMIVESGIDLPNVNTLIINRADRFGLAQLYQLRGRIGRSDRQAYAYLLIPPKSSLTAEARSRLETIVHYTELGSGFQVALKDLEIRGAGNLLGAEQSGFINSVGFELYTELLEQAINEVRTEMGEEQQEKAVKISTIDNSMKIDFAWDAHIPGDYLQDENLRVNFYRKLSNCGTIEELGKLEGEMRDRFGRFPAPLKNLFYLLRVKIWACKVGVKSITIKPARLRIEFIPREGGYKDLIERAVKGADGNQLEFLSHPTFSLKVKFCNTGNDDFDRQAIEKFLCFLAESEI
jgi:transcription-repair coupling factor (superfamily II helicase)